jgi:hypothetical protein
MDGGDCGDLSEGINWVEEPPLADPAVMFLRDAS